MEFVFEPGRSRHQGGLAFDDFSTTAPIRSNSVRRPVTSIDDIEIAGPRKRSSSRKAPVKYVSRAKRDSAFSPSWTKFGWLLCAMLVLRMIFMDGGVVDYYKMENAIQKKIYSLELTGKENAALEQEIHKIKTSPRYQKKMAREHLGVISNNEFLVIFAQDS